MGLVKDWAITQELEKIAKQEALLDLPEGMASTIQLIEEMRAHIEDLQARIQKVIRGGRNLKIILLVAS